MSKKPDERPPVQYKIDRSKQPKSRLPLQYKFIIYILIIYSVLSSVFVLQESLQSKSDKQIISALETQIFTNTYYQINALETTISSLSTQIAILKITPTLVAPTENLTETISTEENIPRIIPSSSSTQLPINAEITPTLLPPPPS